MFKYGTFWLKRHSLIIVSPVTWWLPTSTRNNDFFLTTFAISSAVLVAWVRTSHIEIKTGSILTGSILSHMSLCNLIRHSDYVYRETYHKSWFCVHSDWHLDSFIGRLITSPGCWETCNRSWLVCIWLTLWLIHWETYNKSWLCGRETYNMSLLLGGGRFSTSPTSPFSMREK